MRLRYLLLPTFFIVGAGYLLSQPNWIFSLAARFYPGALYNVDINPFPGAPTFVALTIDDGPGPYTEDILALLARHDAKATFFNLSENLPGYEAVVTQTVTSGHELGNHLTADEASIRLSASEFEADLLAAESALFPFLEGKISGKETLDKARQDQKAKLRWLRPGMGFYTPQMVDIAQRHGYRLALGNNFPYDTHLPNARFASSFILANVQPGDIIVLHDGQGENADRGDRTLQTLKTILPVLKNRGYTVTTLSELTAAAESTSTTAELSVDP